MRVPSKPLVHAAQRPIKHCTTPPHRRQRAELLTTGYMRDGYCMRRTGRSSRQHVRQHRAASHSRRRSNGRDAGCLGRESRGGWSSQPSSSLRKPAYVRHRAPSTSRPHPPPPVHLPLPHTSIPPDAATRRSLPPPLLLRRRVVVHTCLHPTSFSFVSSHLASARRSPPHVVTLPSNVPRRLADPAHPSCMSAR